jgi:hypothetical protein
MIKNITLLVALIPMVAFSKSIQIDELKINISPLTVEVYQGSKHIFSENCSDYTCKIFTSNVENPQINTEDGWVVLSKDIHKLSLKNIKPFKPFYWLDHRFIKFVVSSSNISGSYSKQEEYLIDTTTGAVRVDTQSSDWFKYGLSKNSTNN